MRLVLQRVKNASVSIDGQTVATIGAGLLVFVGLGREDDEPQAWPKIEALLAKLPVLRIFPDESSHMNVSLADYDGEILLVSQFTLHADCRKGRRPSFHLACSPDIAKPLFDKVCAAAEALMPGKIKTGVFAADMDVSLVNWGPVTIILDCEGPPD